MNNHRHSGGLRFFIVTFLLVFSPLPCFPQKAIVKTPASYTASWKTIDSLIDNGLTQSAIDSTKITLKAAKATSNSEQTIKALIYLMRLESFKEEDAFVKSIDRLNEEIVKASFPVKPLLQSMLAECY